MEALTVPSAAHSMQESCSRDNLSTAADVARVLERSDCADRCICHRTAQRGYGPVHCPHHADATPSARVKAGDRGAEWVITCSVCGTAQQAAVLAAARARLGEHPPPLPVLPVWTTPKRRPASASS